MSHSYKEFLCRFPEESNWEPMRHLCASWAAERYCARKEVGCHRELEEGVEVLVRSPSGPIQKFYVEVVHEIDYQANEVDL